MIACPEWPAAPTREAFEGAIDEVAVYGTALTAAQVAANFAASGRTGAPDEFPIAAFGSETDNLGVRFDAAAASDPDGTVVGYSWDFDDGSPAGTGVAPEHTFAAAGTYDVTLTVTDNRGGTGTVTHPVTVAARANQPPTATSPPRRPA